MKTSFVNRERGTAGKSETVFNLIQSQYRRLRPKPDVAFPEIHLADKRILVLEST
jgi:hypothetical protein